MHKHTSTKNMKINLIDLHNIFFERFLDIKLRINTNIFFFFQNLLMCVRVARAAAQD